MLNLMIFLIFRDSNKIFEFFEFQKLKILRQSIKFCIPIFVFYFRSNSLTKSFWLDWSYWAFFNALKRAFLTSKHHSNHLKNIESRDPIYGLIYMCKQFQFCLLIIIYASKHIFSKKLIFRLYIINTFFLFFLFQGLHTFRHLLH